LFMHESMPFLITGISFGLAAGVAPGPLLTLVIAETMRHDKKNGILVAFAPILTDIPIVLMSVYILSRLANLNTMLGVISLAGASFIAYLAYEGLTAREIELDMDSVRPDSLKKGVITNVLSPHPYLFWITVGAPLIHKAYQVSLHSSLFFLLGFYIFLVGSKVVLALIVGRSKAFLSSRYYVNISRGLGAVLLIFAILFIREGLKLFGFV